MPTGHRLPSFEREHFRDVLEDDGLRSLVVERDGELIAHSTFGRSRDADAAPAEQREEAWANLLEVRYQRLL